MTAAYVKYVPHVDRPPGPMLDNYEQRIASDEAFVASNMEFISGVIILIEAADHLLLDNIAVDLDMQGRRIGGRLVDF
ncbi:MAG: GNAT family N-acetyltransferase, partial [Alphaproteobacteria bacterium]|nr:GNAT family N-acetyltransferase [Alphaproteobacteria bacterium]